MPASANIELKVGVSVAATGSVEKENNTENAPLVNKQSADHIVDKHKRRTPNYRVAFTLVDALISTSIKSIRTEKNGN